MDDQLLIGGDGQPQLLVDEIISFVPRSAARIDTDLKQSFGS